MIGYTRAGSGMSIRVSRAATKHIPEPESLLLWNAFTPILNLAEACLDDVISNDVTGACLDDTSSICTLALADGDEYPD